MGKNLLRNLSVLGSAAPTPPQTEHTTPVTACAGSFAHLMHTAQLLPSVPDRHVPVFSQCAHSSRWALCTSGIVPPDTLGTHASRQDTSVAPSSRPFTFRH